LSFALLSMRLGLYPMAKKTTYILALAITIISFGCTTGTFSVNVPIAGGKSRQIQLGSKGPVHAEDDRIAIEKALIQLQPSNKVGNFYFAFRVKTAIKPVAIKIEDMSDDEPFKMYSQNPIQIPDKTWEVKGLDITPNYQGVKWIYEIENSLRVYRFTFTYADGTTTELYEGVSYPSAVKEFLRKEMGLPAEPPAPPKPAEQPVVPNF